MKELLARVTTKGQATIPAGVRRLLGVSAGDKVVCVTDGDQVRLQGGGVVAHTAGALHTSGTALSAEELRTVGEEVIAEEAADRAG